MVHDGGREGLRPRPTRALGLAPVAGGLIGILSVVMVGCAAHPPLHDVNPQAASEEAAGGVFDGVYTEEQSRRGAVVFLATCAPCHRAEMTGSAIVPPLTGEEFLEHWRRKTVGDLFERVRTMPPIPIPKPPTQEEYADVLAYILSRNRFPSGPRELLPDFEALTAIRLGAGD